MSGVPEQVLGQAAAHLMELCLNDCELTLEQYLALMASERQSERLKTLMLKGVVIESFICQKRGGGVCR